MSDRPTSNKGAQITFRNEVLLYMHEVGFSSAYPPRHPHGLTPEERRLRDHGDVLGLPPWTLAIRNQLGIDLGSAMREVESEAATAGTDLYASIQRRTGGTVRQAYVTMPLSVFVKVLELSNPELRSQPTTAIARAG